MKKMIRRRARLKATLAAAVLSLCGLADHGWAAEAARTGSVDLVASYQQALQHDARMRAADEALAAGREKAEQGRALLRPQVALTASLARLDERTSSSLPPALAGLVPSERTGQSHQVALQMTQPLYDAKARAEREQMIQQTSLAEIQHRQARQDLMKRVSEAYLGVLLAEESLRVVRAEKAAVQMQRDRAQARFDVGRGRITEVQETQARYDGVLTREISTESTLAQRRAQFAERTGASGEVLRPLVAGFDPAPPAPDNLVAWQTQGLDQSARVLLKQGELAIAQAETGKWKLAARPTLDLVASYFDRGQHAGLAGSLAGDGSRTASVGLQFNVPLYAGGGLDSRERETLARVRQAEQELTGARRDMRLEVQDAYLAVKTGVARIAALKQQLRSAETALEATTLGRDVGNRTELDVLDAQQRLFGAQLDLAQAHNEYLLGRVRLAAAAGVINEGDIAALNTFLAR
ncbi:MAG: TolC family outer membrane protein [Burkholderiales bacterium]|nr:TolC family outer membrane protein [Burkholderiales bacterium]